MAAGSIIVDLLLKTGSFETDVARATKSVKGLSQGFKDSFGGNLAAGFARSFISEIASIPGRFVALVKSSIDAEDHLGDLSKRTGIAVETLGGIGFAASQAGSSLDGVSSAVGKLNKTLGDAAAGNAKATAALKALGVDAIDPLTGKTTTADVALVQLAKRFENAADSPEKFRAAAQALGKQYQELVPLLDDGAKSLQDNIAYYKKYSGVTKETQQASDAFNDTLGKLSLLTSAFGKNLASELLGPLQAIADRFLEAKEKGDGFRGVAAGIKDALVGISTAAAFVVESLSAMSTRLDGIIQKGEILAEAARDARKNSHGLDIFGTSGVFQKGLGAKFNAVDSQVAADVAAGQKRYDDFVARLNASASASDTPKKGGRIGGTPDEAAANAANAELKKRLDGQLKLIQQWGQERKSALDFANKLLDSEYQDGLISLKNFQDDEASVRQKALRVQLEEQDKIIAAERAFAKNTGNPTDRIGAENRIAEAVQKKTDLIVAAGQTEQLTQRANAREVLALADRYNDLKATILTLQGDEFSASFLKNAQQAREARKLIEQAGGDPAKADELAKQLDLQTQLAKVTKDYGFTVADLSRAEEYLALAQQTGAIGSLQFLALEGEARRKAIPVYEAQVAALEAIAKASGNPAYVKNAEAARLALDKLKASADPLAESLNKTFGDDFNSALSDFVTGTKSAADAFKSFSKSVLNDILKMGSKSITESLFGGSGGIGGLISSWFGTGSGTGAASAGAGWLSSLGSMFAGFFADGGVIPPGKVAVVGEHGKELAFGGMHGQTIVPSAPQGKSSARAPIVVNVQMPQGATRETGNQFGAAIAQRLAVSDQRFN